MIHLQEKIKYVLVRQRGIGNLEGDFNQILAQLGTHSGIGLTNHGDGKATISYTETPRKATLTMPENKETSDIAPSQQMTLVCERKDNVSVNLLRNVVGNIGYRVFNPEIQSYLPNDPNLMDITTIKISEKVQAVFEKLNFSPLFNYRNSLIYYAKPKNGKTIHLINRDLLEHYVENGFDSERASDFSLEVAADINRFIALQDRGLIPISFYKYFNSPTKIINLSGFDIEKLESDILVRQNLYKFIESEQTFKNVENKNTHRMNRLKSGQSLKHYIERVHNNLDLDIDFDLLAAKIATNIEYEKDKDDKTLPQLFISIFFNEKRRDN